MSALPASIKAGEAAVSKGAQTLMEHAYTHSSSLSLSSSLSHTKMTFPSAKMKSTASSLSSGPMIGSKNAEVGVLSTAAGLGVVSGVARRLDDVFSGAELLRIEGHTGLVFSVCVDRIFWLISESSRIVRLAIARNVAAAGGRL